jgi:hypothetical protein
VGRGGTALDVVEELLGDPDQLVSLHPASLPSLRIDRCSDPGEERRAALPAGVTAGPGQWKSITPGQTIVAKFKTLKFV